MPLSRNLPPLALTRELVEHYRRYLGTTFPVQGALRDDLLRELSQPEMLVKGPILEATPPFVRGRSLAELVEAGQASSGFLELGLDPDRPLYHHQERAFTQVVHTDRNAIIATGTGSGKTESFLFPILEHLLREREAGTLDQPGVRALLVYPMNALAHDQLKRLRELLARVPEITFGRYTGDTPGKRKDGINQFGKLFPDQPLLPNELVSRDAMQEAPPHILLTNYAMLEYLLLRPDDHVFFDGDHARHWRFWVLDELHTYQGATATDVAMLLRRVKDRIVTSERGRIRCLGTSATLGDGQKDNPAVAAFAEQLFGEPFEADDIVLAEREPLHEASSEVWGEPCPELYSTLRKALEADTGLPELADLARTQGVPEDVVTAAIALAGATGSPRTTEAAEVEVLTGADDPDDWWRDETETTPRPHALSDDPLPTQRFLYGLLAGDGRIRRVRSHLASGPIRVKHLAERVFSADPDDEQTMVDLVELAANARQEAGDLPLLPARYHVFARAIEGAFVTFRPGDPPTPILKLERAVHAEIDGQVQRVFEMCSCRRCGQPFVAGRLVRDPDLGFEVLKQFPEGLAPDEAGGGQDIYLRWDDPALGETDEDDTVAAGETKVARIVQEPCRLCLICGSTHPDGQLPICGHEDERQLRVHRVRTPDHRAGLKRCPSCQFQPRKGAAVGPLSLGQDAPVAVLGTVLYQRLPADPEASDRPGEGRKLIVFSDSRQDAAYFAPYLQASYAHLLDRRRVYLPFTEAGRHRAHSLEAHVDELASEPRRSLFPGKEDDPDARAKQAWIWVMSEFRTIHTRLSLEGVGLVAFRPRPTALPDFPEKGVAQLQKVLGIPDLTRAEAQALLEVLLLSLRRSGAVTFPDRVMPTEAHFAPLTRHVYCRKSGASPEKGILAWLPGAHATNRRLDYVERLASAAGGTGKVKREDLNPLLDRLFDFLKREKLLKVVPGPSGEGEVLQLDHGKWEIMPTRGENGRLAVSLHACPVCRNLTTVQVRQVCPTFRCTGKLVKLDDLPDDDHHYRHLYRTLEPVQLEASEHTAQLARDSAALTQQKFIAGEINVLSCSTTFELGVDVGELQAVLMRNVPPATANYLQRAGRAGRRADSVAFVVTYAQQRAHDQYHYRDPEQMVGGRMAPPTFLLGNEKIVRKHVHAMAFSMLFRQHPDLIHNLQSFFETGDAELTGDVLLARWLDTRPAVLLESLVRVVPPEVQGRLDLSGWGWVADLVHEREGLLTQVREGVLQDLKQYDDTADAFWNRKESRRASYYNRLATTIRKRHLLGYLAGNRVLPKYGFPIHTVDLEILADVPDAHDIELSRDLRLAIGEYAPGSQVVARGKVWTSVGLKRQPLREWEQHAYQACKCGWFRLLNEEPDAKACGHCGKELEDPRTFIVPEFGFVTGNETPDEVTDVRPQRSYASRVYFAETAPDVEEPNRRRVGSPNPEAGMHLTISSPHSGVLVVVNEGPGRHGFNICLTCGRALELGKKKLNHERPWGGDCPVKHGEQIQFTRHLGHKFASDVVVLQFGVPSDMDRSSAFWWSLVYALLEGASRALQIRRDDLDGCVYTHDRDQSIVLFDNVPGGAGHVRLIESQIETVLREALHVVQSCTCEHDTSCYSCLRTYRNQPVHGLMQRGLVQRYLERFLAACLASEPDGRHAIGASGRGRWLERELARARKALLVASQLAIRSDGTPPAGAPDWLRLLRERGKSMRLVLQSDRLPRRDDAAGALLLHELKGLVLQGLDLRLMEPGTALPEWAIGIETADGARLVQWTDPDKGIEEGLSPTTGLSGLVTTVQPAACETGLEALNRFIDACPRLTTEHPLFRGPTMRFERLKQGQPTTIQAIIDTYLKVHFRADDRSARLFDPYLRKWHQRRNLEALIDALRASGRGNPFSFTFVTSIPPDEAYPDQIRREHERIVRDGSRAGFKVACGYGSFHGRSLQIERADGTWTTILLDRGLDMLDRDQRALDAYLATFDHAEDPAREPASSGR